MIWVILIIIFVSLLAGDYAKNRERKELLATIKSTKTSEDTDGRFRCPACAQMFPAMLHLTFGSGRCATDKLDLVAVGVVNVHRPAGYDRVLSAARMVPCRY